MNKIQFFFGWLLMAVSVAIIALFGVLYFDTDMAMDRDFFSITAFAVLPLFSLLAGFLSIQSSKEAI